MNEDLWPKIRRGDYVIYADQYDGVHKAVISETDLRVRDEEKPGGWFYPYGQTADTGAVKIKYTADDVEQEKLSNLADLITFTVGAYRQLLKAWTTYEVAHAAAEAHAETFNGLRNSML